MKALNTIPQYIKENVQKYPSNVAIKYRPTVKESVINITYQEFYSRIKAYGASFIKLGIKRGDHVAIISDNRKEWLLCDIALMGLGAIDVPRGSDCSSQELCYIIDHSDANFVIFENANQLKKWQEGNPDTKNIKAIILMDYNDLDKNSKLKIYSLEELLKEGQEEVKLQEQFEEELAKGQKEDISTIIYTSGTTGEPKGVILTQESFVFQIERIYEYIPIRQPQIMLSVLPVWHTFERICEYILMCCGATLAYSKPIGAVLLKDLGEINPQWLTSVPRIWESIYDSVMKKVRKSPKAKQAIFNFFVRVSTIWCKCEALYHDKNPSLTPYNPTLNKVIAFIPYWLLFAFKKVGELLVFNNLKKLLGSNFVAGVSGGGALPPYIDYFFKSAGITILEGYGITETAPIIAVRKCSHPVMRTIGTPLPDIEYKILNKKGEEVKKGTKGQLFVKSPQVMKGYYKDEVKTSQVIKDGWFDTGDLVIQTYNRDAIKIVGRAKETIVLIGGENIEPTPIEERLTASPYISYAMVVGQDQRSLGLLVNLDKENLKEYLTQLGEQIIDDHDMLTRESTINLINQEVQSIINTKNGFKSYERIGKVAIIEKDFEIGTELTKTIKLRRSVISKMYAKEIASLFKN